MKNSIKLLAGLAMLAFAGTASAQNTASTGGTANATVICPIHITLTNGLDFGNVIVSNGGSVTVPVSGSVTYSPLGIQPGTQVGSPMAANFHVHGEANYWFNSAASAISADNGCSLSLSGANNAALQLDGSGDYTLTVGGVLTMSGATIPGAVTGSWTETVSYN